MPVLRFATSAHLAADAEARLRPRTNLLGELGARRCRRSSKQLGDDPTTAPAVPVMRRSSHQTTVTGLGVEE
jgi:hypothetical protein